MTTSRLETAFELELQGEAPPPPLERAPSGKAQVAGQDEDEEEAPHRTGCCSCPHGVIGVISILVTLCAWGVSSYATGSCDMSTEDWIIDREVGISRYKDTGESSGYAECKLFSQGDDASDVYGSTWIATYVLAILATVVIASVDLKRWQTPQNANACGAQSKTDLARRTGALRNVGKLMPKQSSTAYQAHPFFRFMRRLSTYYSEDILGGPRVLKLSWVINFQKGGTLFFVGFLMWWYQNFSTAAWVYLSIHGSYGLCWVLKDIVFPDPNFQKKVTFGGAFVVFATVLGPYWSFAFLLISDFLGPRTQPSMALLSFCVGMHTLGIAIMMVADTQKYYTLKAKCGLITDGMFKYIRHPNYLGEMMIYGSYALVVQHWIVWAVLMWVWSALFLTNMKMKEASLSRYPEWVAYKARTGLLLPPLFSRSSSVHGTKSL